MRVAAIDQGTTSTRCLVVEDGGAWRLAAQRRHTARHPRPGWVEHDPEELLANIRAVLEAAGLADAVALANQGESCLAWDSRTGQPLSPVIVWQDARTADALRALGSEADGLSRQIAGVPLDPYFSAGKLGWILANLPEAAQARREGRLRLGTTDAFFLQRLTGHFATDPATASRTGLLDLKSGAWSTALCDLHGVPVECLPEIRPVDAGFGTIGETPLTVSIVDQQAALHGHGCRETGDAKITFGTGAFLLALAPLNEARSGPLLPTIAWQRQDADIRHALEGGVYDAGSALEWARQLGLFSHTDELAAFERPAAISRGLAFVPALSGLAAPHWDRTAAPLMIGMDHATDRRDVLQSILEGVAFLTAGLLDAAARQMPLAERISIDGGLSQSPYFAQFLANLSGRTIAVAEIPELTALGLAELSGVDVSNLRRGWKEYGPDGTSSLRAKERYANALARATNWR
jgi:glycerol kinase